MLSKNLFPGIFAPPPAQQRLPFPIALFIVQYQSIHDRCRGSCRNDSSSLRLFFLLVFSIGEQCLQNFERDISFFFFSFSTISFVSKNSIADLQQVVWRKIFSDIDARFLEDELTVV